MGKVFVGGLDGKEGIFVCLDAATGKRLWQWQAPPREVPNTIDGFSIGIGTIPPQIGVCPSAAVDGENGETAGSHLNHRVISRLNTASESGRLCRLDAPIDVTKARRELSVDTQVAAARCALPPACCRQ